MKRISVLKSLRIPVVVLAGFLLGASSSYAVDLAAVEGQWTPPEGGAPITMWGFVPDTTGPCPAPGSWDVGPLQVEAPGGNLTIMLRNCLSEPVSIVIPGQNAILTPTMVGPDAQGRFRATSFTHEAPSDAGATTTLYTWTNLKPGTFLYQSGSNPAKQVQMGLFGALTVGTYSADMTEVLVLYSEIDPDLHNGTPAAATPLSYKPKYFLVNGEAYSSGQAVPVVTQAGVATQKELLIRFANAGLMSHVPVMQGPYMKIIAEDGNPYPYAREQYSALLAAGKTLDALWSPVETGTFALYDRSLSLSSNGVPGGGLLVYLDVDIGVDVPPAYKFPWVMFVPAITGAGTKP
jgi:FtsP/CotA-like multicopper oxidase with cupredoxin domain